MLKGRDDLIRGKGGRWRGGGVGGWFGGVCGGRLTCFCRATCVQL